MFVLLSLAVGCSVGGTVANTLGDIVGETGDAHCDRRFVTEGGERSGFCQEIVDTLVTRQFKDACAEKHKAMAGDGKCPRERIIGGCQLLIENRDGSKVWDWYYDVSDLEGGLLPDGGSEIQTTVRTKEDVQRLCDDRDRYENGAAYRDP